MTQYYALDIRVNYMTGDTNNKQLKVPSTMSFDHYPVLDGKRPYTCSEFPLVDKNTGEEYIATVHKINPSSDWKRNARISAHITVDSEEQFRDVMRVLRQYS